MIKPPREDLHRQPDVDPKTEEKPTPVTDPHLWARTPEVVSRCKESSLNLNTIVPFSKKASAFQQLLGSLSISHLLFKSINRDVFLKKETTDNYEKINNMKATQAFSSFMNMFPSCWDYQYLSTTATEYEAQFN